VLTPPDEPRDAGEWGTVLVPDQRRPLRHWMTQNRFREASECEAALEAHASSSARVASGYGANSKVPRSELPRVKTILQEYARWNSARCRPESDPRLVIDPSVTWYLLIPPLMGKGRDYRGYTVETSAPFHRWDADAGFQSAEACERALVKARERTKDGPNAYTDDELRQLTRITSVVYNADLCIRSTDERIN
jgi:hypothetical protein